MANKTNGSDQKDSEDTTVFTHLEDIEDGAGCTEIWQKLTEHRSGKDN